MEQNSNGGNVITAVILSVGVLLAWDYFFASKKPQMPTEQATQNTPLIPPHQDHKNPTAGLSVNHPAHTIATGFENLNDILRETQKNRLVIETPALQGSIDLSNGRFDDLIMQEFNQTLKGDQKVRLLAPSTTDRGFFAQIDYKIADIPPQKNIAWQVVSGALDNNNKVVTLKKTYNNIDITRRITLDDHYMFQISDTLTNRSTQDITFTPYGLVKENDPAFREKDSSYVVHTGFVGYVNGSLLEESFDDIKDEKFTDGSIDASTGGWIGMTDKYWATVLIPDASEPLKIRAFYNPFANHDGYQADYTLRTRQLKAGQSVILHNKLFAGAKSVTLVEKYSDNLKISGFDFLIDWGWFWFFTKPIFKGLLYFYHLVGNYGIAILLLTLSLKICFFPLANKSYTAMSRMKKLQPKIEKIKEKNSKDPMAQQQELINLYKQEKINPVAGCWPMLLQIPVFFALYKVLNVALELRHQPFFGWIHDLSAPDPTNLFTLFGLIPLDMPSFLHIGIWPLLMGITMWMQQRLNPAPSDPIQAKMMSLLPIIFTFILAPFSAGLVIYWTWNNLLSIVQQAVIMRKLGVPIEFRLWKKS